MLGMGCQRVTPAMVEAKARSQNQGLSRQQEEVKTCLVNLARLCLKIKSLKNETEVAGGDAGL